MVNDPLTPSQPEPKGFSANWPIRSKLGLVFGLVIILLVLLALGWWSQRAPKAVLFSDLAERDAAVLTAELDRLKHPYSLGPDGRSILVAADTVHRTRLALMGKPLPLHGAVGFELFNNADLGVSDFVQKVNYQRALQGELTRTILSIEQVQDVRVHLVIPEPLLFRKDAQKAKASVTLSLKGGHPLAAEQVLGIQRLVAASVPEIKPEDVTVVGPQGAVLSRALSDEGAAAASQLDTRQGLEALLASKANRLLDQLFQPGDAMVAVDVTLNLDQSRVTTEEALGAGPADREGHPAGVITRERTTTREPAADAQGQTGGAAAQLQSQETDYLPGRRITQIASPAGRVARLSAAVVVRRALTAAELAQVRQLVATAVGLQPDRGDTVTVQSINEVAAGVTPGQAPASAGSSHAPPQAEDPPTPASPSPRLAPGTPAAALTTGWTWIGGTAALIALASLGAWAFRTRRPAQPHADLSATERDALLAALKQWLEPQR